MCCEADARTEGVDVHQTVGVDLGPRICIHSHGSLGTLRCKRDARSDRDFVVPARNGIRGIRDGSREDGG